MPGIPCNDGATAVESGMKCAWHSASLAVCGADKLWLAALLFGSGAMPAAEKM